jgi:Peroxidase, family 2
MHKFDESSISLHDFARHGLIEHDASVVHKDVEKGRAFAPTRCDTALLDDLLNGSSLTLDQVARKRVLLEKDAPVGPVYQEIARGEWALTLDIFGRESGGEIRPEIMRIWLKENRFIEGWKPSHQQGLVDTICKSREIRQKMNEFRKDCEHSSTERRVREAILASRRKTEQCRLPSSTDRSCGCCGALSYCVKITCEIRHVHVYISLWPAPRTRGIILVT